jgi:hypothetical protein
VNFLEKCNDLKVEIKSTLLDNKGYRDKSLWLVELTRNGKSVKLKYTMGSAYRVAKCDIEDANFKAKKGKRIPQLPSRITVWIDEQLRNNTVPEEPKLDDVLHSMFMDVGALRNCADVKEFCRELGYVDRNGDILLSGLKVWRGCKRSAKKLKILGISMKKLEEIFGDY